MCGRYYFYLTTDEFIQVLRDDYDIDNVQCSFDLPRYNIAPSQDVVTIINDGKRNRVGYLRWGFNKTIINAKAETLTEKVLFKHPFKHQRCIILANGFYEWKKTENKKLPMVFFLKEKQTFAFAGLYRSYIDTDNKKIFTCTIITTEANDLVKTVHNRMPVILTKETEKIWLNPSIKDNSTLSTVLLPYSANEMACYQVSSIVNNAKNDIKECLKPIV